MKRRAPTACAAIAAIALSGGCVPLRQPFPEPVEWLVVPAELAQAAGVSPIGPHSPAGSEVPPGTSAVVSRLLRMDVGPNRTWITERRSVPAYDRASARRAAVLVLGGESRDPAAVLRILHADTAGRRRAATDLAHSVAAERLHVLVFAPGQLSPRDLNSLLISLSDLIPAGRAGGVFETGIAVPGADTAAYPSRPLTALADALLMTVAPPAPSADAGPQITVEAMRRAIGLRVAQIGQSRIVVLLPTHGYLWQADSAPRAISFSEGLRFADDWRASLVRDPASETLFARAAGKGELWVTDARLVALLLREARGMGVHRFGIVLGAGEDGEILDSLSVITR